MSRIHVDISVISTKGEIDYRNDMSILSLVMVKIYTGNRQRKIY